MDPSHYFLLNRPWNKSYFPDDILQTFYFIPMVQNLELLGNSCAIKAFLYRGLKHIKNTKLELNVQENYSEQLHLKQQLKLHFLLKWRNIPILKDPKITKKSAKWEETVGSSKSLRRPCIVLVATGLQWNES